MLPSRAHRSGDPSVKGWLLEHSRLLRYFLRWRLWLERPQEAARLARHEARMLPNGQLPNEGTRRPDWSAKRDRRVRRTLSRATAERIDEAALSRLLDGRGSTTILLLEMPLTARYRALFPGAQPGYEAIMARFARIATAQGAPLWQTSDHDLIPDGGWSNNNHLNQRGARVFSRWLGIASHQPLPCRPAPPAGPGPEHPR